MNKNKKEEEEKEEKETKKLFQQLPEVKASADFEQRLHRRIESSSSFGHSRARWWSLVERFHIPAYSYSVAAIAIVGVFAYYALYQSNSLKQSPSPPQREFPVSSPRDSGADIRRDDKFDRQKEISPKSKRVGSETDVGKKVPAVAPASLKDQDAVAHGEPKNLPLQSKQIPGFVTDTAHAPVNAVEAKGERDVPSVSETQMSASPQSIEKVLDSAATIKGVPLMVAPQSPKPNPVSSQEQSPEMLKSVPPRSSEVKRGSAAIESATKIDSAKDDSLRRVRELRRLKESRRRKPSN